MVYFQQQYLDVVKSVYRFPNFLFDPLSFHHCVFLTNPVFVCHRPFRKKRIQNRNEHCT